MPDFLIQPRFNQANNSLFFHTDSLNSLQQAEYNDKFGFYQRMFGVYSYMQMTKDLEYKIHYPKSTPLIWQPHNSCAWTPTGTLSMDQKTIAPCKVKINEQYCYDELFESTFKSFTEWGRSTTVQMDALGVQYTNELARTIIENATLGARLTLSAGQIHDLTSVVFEDGASSRIRDAFNRTTLSCQGWLKLIQTLKTTYSWLETGDIIEGSISSDAKEYTGSVVDLYDAIFAASPAKLRNAVVEGGIGGFNGIYYPMLIISPSMYRAVHADWITQKTTAMVNEPRITRREFMIDTNMGQKPVYVYFIDDTVIIPLQEIAEWEEYVTGTSHFAYLTVSGVIQAGSSFGSIPNAPGKVGVMVQMSQNAEDYGTHKFLSHALLATGINDTDYIAGDYVYAVPA